MNHAAASHSTGSPDDAAAALKGASLAFQRSPAVTATSLPLSPPPLVAADTAASSNSRSKSPLRLSSQATGSTSATDYGRSRSRSRSRGSRDHFDRHLRPGISSKGADAVAQQASMAATRLDGQSRLDSPAWLQPSSAANAHLDAASTSFIAAKLAASRSVSPSPAGRTPRRDNSSRTAPSLAVDAVDNEPIAPTGSLISMFERVPSDSKTLAKRSDRGLSAPESDNYKLGRNHVASKKKGTRVPSPQPSATLKPLRPSADGDRSDAAAPRSSTPPLRSSDKISAMPMPKPKLPQELSMSPRPRTGTKPPPEVAGSKLEQIGAPSAPKLVQTAAAKPRKTRAPSPPSLANTSTIEVLSPKPLRLIKPVLAPPAVSSPLRGGSPSRSSQAVASPSPSPEKRSEDDGLRPPPPGRPRKRGNSGLSPFRLGSSSATPLTEFGLPIVSPAPVQPTPPQRLHKKTSPPPPPPARREVVVTSAPVSPVPPRSRRRLTNSSTNNLPFDTLTNAIMASSLASARLTPQNTGSSLPPPSLPRRQKSPRLLQTLRQPHSHADEDPERLKIAHRHKLSRHKHSHHEGSRKRWRDEITERERKRYEAVWASNRGYLLDDFDDILLGALDDAFNRTKSDCVVDVAVREIWRRSRLPEDELMEVWDLVDRVHLGMLSRQEFVVGMWLIDQRLKGRKLPAKVSDSVWASANGVHMLKLKGKG